MADLSLPVLLPTVKDPELAFRKYLNFLLALRARRERSETVNSRPIAAVIDPSSACQLACPYCALGAKELRRPRAFMKPELHARLMDTLGDSLFVIHYFNTGEPLLNKDFTKLVRQTAGKEIHSILSTNLSLPLSQERIEDLLTCGLGTIAVSLDGSFADTYGRYRRQGDFDLVVENLHKLIATKQRLDLEYPLIEWRFLIFKHNQHQLRDARTIAATWGVDVLEFFHGSAPTDAVSPMPQLDTGPDLLGHATSGPAIDRALERRDTPYRMTFGNELFTDGPAAAPELRFQKCDWLYLGVAAYPDGAVGPCCVSNHEEDDFGRLTPEGDLSELWNGEMFRSARRLFVGGQGSDTVCARCPGTGSQDYQFRITIQALIRNAPAWVLAILARSPDEYFYPVDFALSHIELSAVRRMGHLVDPSFPQIAERLRECARREPAQATELESMARELLGEATTQSTAALAASPP